MSSNLPDSNPTDAGHSLAEKLCLAYVKRFDVRTSHTQPSDVVQVPGDYSKSLDGFTAKFPDFLESIQGATVLDYGCAQGNQCIGLVQQGAKRAVGMDVQENRILAGRQRLETLGLTDRIELSSTLPDDYEGRFDVVVTLNCMEHFPDPALSLRQMRDALTPDGRIYLTFGPLWYSAYGPHQYEFTNAPWIHLLFGERTVMKTRGILLNDPGCRTYRDRWLNKMSVRRFEKYIAGSGMKVDQLRYDCSGGLTALGKVPILRELLVNNISCVLTRS